MEIIEFIERDIEMWDTDSRYNVNIQRECAGILKGMALANYNNKELYDRLTQCSGVLYAASNLIERLKKESPKRFPE